jgi:hypothetical protein
MHIYLQYALMYLLGQALHLLLIKIPELRELSRANNHEFSLKEWAKKDWNVIVGSALLGPVLFIGLDQIIKIKPWVENITVWLFWGVGVMGNALAMRFSAYSQKVMRYLDVKSNFSDATIGKTENINDLIDKGTRLTGFDITQSPTTYGDRKKDR